MMQKLTNSYKGPASPQVTKVVKHPVDRHHRDAKLSAYPSNTVSYTTIMQYDLMFSFRGSNEVFSVFNNLYKDKSDANLDIEQRKENLQKSIQFHGWASSIKQERDSAIQPSGFIAVNYDGFLQAYNADSQKWSAGDLLTFALPDLYTEDKRLTARFTLIRDYEIDDNLIKYENYTDIPEEIRINVENEIEAWENSASYNPDKAQEQVIMKTVLATSQYTRMKYRMPVIAKVVEPIEQDKLGKVMLIGKF